MGKKPEPGCVIELPGRTKPFKAQLRMKGFKPKIGYFYTEPEAWEYLREIAADQNKLNHGQEPTRDNLRRLTVGSLLDEYLRKRTHRKASAETEETAIKNFLARYKDRKLIAFTKYDAKEYIEYLESEYVSHHGKPLKPATVNRIVASFNNAWNYAEENWRGYEGLANPWRKKKAEGQVKDRTRRPSKDEIDRILHSAMSGCKGDNLTYAPLAILLAIETGMRLQEIFNLTWDDIHLDRRRIHIRWDKTSYKKRVNGRWTVLTLRATQYLFELAPDKSQRKGRVFPMSKGAFKQVFEAILMRAGIPFQYRDYKQPDTFAYRGGLSGPRVRIPGKIIPKDGEGLTFHDLKREAASRLKRALYKEEIAMLLGDDGKAMIDIYLEYDEDDLTEIQNKLDRYDTREFDPRGIGFTAKELKEQGKVILWDWDTHMSILRIVSKDDPDPMAFARIETRPQNVVPLRRRRG